MENASKTPTHLVLLGIVEMERLRYVYASSGFILYIVTMVLSSMIVYTVWSEETLHEPMYIFIGNLVVNAMFGNSAIVPKIVTDLLFGFSTVSLPGCLIQAFCAQCFACFQYFIFTAMSYDQYLAIGYPLRYSTLMTNGRVFRILFAVLVVVLLNITIIMVLVGRLPMCGVFINNVFCESLSLLHLACGDTTVLDVYGTVYTLAMVIGCILVVIYSYIRTFLVCLKMSGESYHKATHTLVTHMVTFSTCTASGLFVTFRYRLGRVSLSTAAHVIFSIIGLLASIIFYPLMYGIRTEALKIKMFANLKKMYLYQGVAIKKVTPLWK